MVYQMSRGIHHICWNHVTCKNYTTAWLAHTLVVIQHLHTSNVNFQMCANIQTTMGLWSQRTHTNNIFNNCATLEGTIDYWLVMFVNVHLIWSGAEPMRTTRNSQWRRLRFAVKQWCTIIGFLILIGLDTRHLIDTPMRKRCRREFHPTSAHLSIWAHNKSHHQYRNSVVAAAILPGPAGQCTDSSNFVICTPLSEGTLQVGSCALAPTIPTSGLQLLKRCKYPTDSADISTEC